MRAGSIGVAGILALVPLTSGFAVNSGLTDRTPVELVNVAVHFTVTASGCAIHSTTGRVEVKSTRAPVPNETVQLVVQSHAKTGTTNSHGFFDVSLPTIRVPRGQMIMYSGYAQRTATMMRSATVRASYPCP